MLSCVTQMSHGLQYFPYEVYDKVFDSKCPCQKASYHVSGTIYSTCQPCLNSVHCLSHKQASLSSFPNMCNIQLHVFPLLAFLVHCGWQKAKGKKILYKSLLTLDLLFIKPKLITRGSVADDSRAIDIKRVC